MDISGDVEAKKRTLKILVFGIHAAGFAKMGLVSLSSMLDDTISCKGIRRMKACTEIGR